jgi:hypothetical protein
MPWVIVNGILSVVMFAIILAVMFAGMRWQRASEKAELERQAARRRRREETPVLANDRQLEAELQALIERSAPALR